MGKKSQKWRQKNTRKDNQTISTAWHLIKHTVIHLNKDLYLSLLTIIFMSKYNLKLFCVYQYIVMINGLAHQ